MNTHIVTPKYKIGQIIEYKTFQDCLVIDKINKISAWVGWEKNGKSELRVNYKTRNHHEFEECQVTRVIAEE